MLIKNSAGKEIHILLVEPDSKQMLAAIKRNIISKTKSQLPRLDEASKSLLIDTAASNDIGIISAKFENICARNNVLIALPPADRCLKFFSAHFCLIKNGPKFKTDSEIVFIPKHWRRGLPLDNGEQIYRNFYTEQKEFFGKTAIADLTFQIKFDLIGGRKNLVMNCENIRPSDSCRAEYSLKLNTKKGKYPSLQSLEIPIPGISDKCVCLIKQ